jgi:hypothetical protein
MSEEIEDIPYVKFLSTEVLTPVANEATLGVWGEYEIVNIGTAPTTGELSVTVFIGHSGATWKYQSRDLDDPVLDANGGSYKGTVHFPLDQLPWPGDWDMGFQVNLGINKGISDHVGVPFKVEHAVN